MRFEHLALTAFGPFTDQDLDLSGGAPGGVHVVFGPNEAGKSTALRAVVALLFGIPTRTQDAHLHPYGKLRVGARLSHAGRDLVVTRVKRRKDDLLDAEGQPLASSQLDEFLNHLDQRSFTRRFGLDQAELELGAEALLGGGEEGLFAAGTAGTLARRVLDALGAEAEELFLPRGKVPRLNRALASFSEAQKLAKQLVRPPEKWLEQKQAQQLTEAEAQTLRQQRSRLRAEHARLSRLASLLSDLARLEQVEAERAALASVPRLDPEAPHHRETAQQQLREAELNVQHFTEESARIAAQLAELPDPGPLANVQHEHLELGDRLGRARSAHQDLPKLIARRQAVAETVQRALRSLGVETTSPEAIVRAEQLLPTAAQEKRIGALIAERAALDKELELARREARQAEREESDCAEALGDEPLELDELAATVADAQSRRSLVERATEMQERIAARQASIEGVRQRLGLTDASAQTVAPLPTADELRETADLWQALDAQHERLASEVGALAEELATIQARRDALQGNTELPSEEKLVRARSLRDRLVSQVGGSDAPTAARLATAVRDADAVADGLRREASRLAELQSLTRAEAELAARHQARSQELTTAAERRVTQHRLAWTRLTSSEPLPGSATGYRERGAALLSLFADERELAAERAAHSALLTSLEEVATRLRQAVTTLGLAPVPASAGLVGTLHHATGQLEDARRRLEQHRDRTARRERARLRAQAAETSQREASHRIVEWEAAFARVAGAFATGSGAAVEQIRDALAELSQLRGVLAEARQLTNRIDGIERDSRAFRADIQRITERHAPELATLDPIPAGEQLLERIRNSRRLARDRTQLATALEQSRARLHEAQSAVRAATARLDELMREAGTSTVAELREVEERSRRAVQLDHERADLQRNLLHKSSGRDLDELRGEARGIEHHELFAQIDELTEQLDHLDERIRDLEQTASGYAEGLRRYGSEDVAWARQRAVLRAAEARALLGEYLVVRTARLILDQQVARYADRFAGPIAQRASELFSGLTRGAYSQLRIGVGEHTIRLVRGGDEVEVDQLSRGTRAQLYLALRLASLEAHFQEHPPVPLILDDLFVDFDDDRARAAFEILGELGKSVQILYFTHLGRDLEAAQRAVPADRLFEHRLAR